MKKYCLLYIIGLLFPGCERVESLSNAAEVTAVSILHSEPAAIKLGAPVIIDDETIAIPVLYGKYEFPLRLRLSVSTSGDVAKILDAKEGGGLLNMDEMVFETIDEVKAFYVVAASGKVKPWKLRLLETLLDEQTQIRRFDILSYAPANAVLSAHANIKHSENEIEILTITPVFPLSITPDLRLAGAAHIAGYAPGDALSFASIDAVVPLQVIAESGKNQTWNVKLVQCRDAGEEPSLGIALKNRLDLPADSVSFQLSQGEVKHIAPDYQSGIIALHTQGQSFPSTVTAQLRLHPAARLVAPAGTSFTFANFGDTAFYVVDTISTYYKKWTLRLAEWRNPEADIKEFTVGTASTITWDDPHINPLNATVTLKITSGAASFPFTAQIDLTLSDGAIRKDNAPQTFTHTFQTMKDSIPITIVAQSGRERVWNVRLVNADPSSPNKRTGNDVTAFTIYDYSSEKNALTGSKVELAPEAVIDAAGKTVSIRITNWKKYFPLKLKAAIALSGGAASELDAVETLEFATANDTRPFTVTAENGSAATWTLRFLDEEPPKSSLAALTDFSVGDRLSANSRIEKIYIEPVKKKVVILLPQAQFPLRISPTMAVSPEAHLLDVNSGEEIVFNGFGDTKQLRLLPQDESGITTYNIVLVNAPQLPNHTLEEWSDAQHAAGWSSPNATGIITMSQTTGYAGNYAAKLTSATATILGSIKVTASGSLFLGRFDYQIMYADKPKLMTWFGIPWAARPVALEADYTYQRGAQLVNSAHDPVSGVDEGSATIELLHWAGNGTLKYHTIAPDDAYGKTGSEAESPGITVTARAKQEHIAPTTGWQTLRMELATLDASKTPNYIHITFASSARGDKQIGADGSTLVIDNVRLLYYQPESGAIERD